MLLCLLYNLQVKEIKPKTLLFFLLNSTRQILTKRKMVVLFFLVAWYSIKSFIKNTTSVFHDFSETFKIWKLGSPQWRNANIEMIWVLA